MISVFVNIFKNEIRIKICRQSGEAYRIKGVIRCMTVPKNKTYEERNSNVKSNLVSFLLALSGFIFSIYMQSMAYWSNDSMLWYWVGAVLSYLFAAGSMVTLILHKNKDSILTIKLSHFNDCNRYAYFSHNFLDDFYHYCMAVWDVKLRGI